MTPHEIEHCLQILDVIFLVAAFHNQIINVTFDCFPEMFLENLSHRSLVCGTGILQTERHHRIAEDAEGCSKRRMLLILWMHLDLVISRKSIHEGHPLKSTCIVDNDIRDWEREIVFRTCFIQVPEVDANPDFAILLHDGNDVG